MTAKGYEERRVLSWPCGCQEWRVQTISNDGEEVLGEETLREEWCPERKALEEDAVRLEQHTLATYAPPPRSPEVEQESKRLNKRLMDAKNAAAAHLDRLSVSVNRG